MKVELKTQANDASVTDFLASVEPERRRRDAMVIRDMMARITGFPPRMWGSSIVGYGAYSYRNKSGQEAGWFLTGFSPRKQALSLYIMPGFADQGALMAKLGKHRTGRSCLYINKLDDVDLTVLERLIAVSVDFMRDQYDLERP